MSRLTDHSVLCFDVYGTLIDWESGILTALEPLTSQITTEPPPSRTTLLSTFHTLESRLQSQSPNLPYSTLLSHLHPLFASHFSLPSPTQSSSDAFGQSISHWPAFPDTVSALQRLRADDFKLVVLSNVDRASFAATNAGSLEGFDFHRVITAEEVGSYKPDLRNFRYMLEEVRQQFDVGKEGVLQTAQSLFHDHVPAKAVGLRSVWIERAGGVMGVQNGGEEKGGKGEVYDWRFATLGEMADAVEKEIEEQGGNRWYRGH